MWNLHYDSGMNASMYVLKDKGDIFFNKFLHLNMYVYAHAENVDT